ncbi:FUSC family membrane protein [Salegentibacter flavus]|uniref:TIGR01666 family membrane protein n=1 Tax=Salegentibacter flavus TaxID=287099 RepID=A0A1I4Z6I5_9FLAO|nr:FUSC family membrane protein [Salegentibacter flavus]SFN45894.1 TIGR01666 family membrane protein [Salegentibacter flavus]
MNRIKNYFEDLLKFFRSPDFSKAVILSIAISLPIAVFSYLGNYEIGVALAIGALLSSPSDIQGSFSHKIIGVFLAAILAGMVSLFFGYASVKIWILLPVLALLVFGIAYLAVFGFRASLVAFSGLFAIVLSFANISTALEIWERALLIVLGGLWYLLLSVFWHYLNPKRATEQLLAQALELTGLYLKTRAQLLTETEKRESLKKELFRIQGELNEKHESLRDTLIRSRLNFGNSNYARKRLLIFIELVDILELAIANPVDYDKMEEVFGKKSKMPQKLSSLVDSLALQLDEIAISLQKNSNYTQKEIRDNLEKIETGFSAFRKNLDSNDIKEHMFLLQNLFDYLERQAQKINTIVRILYNLEDRKRVFPKKNEVLKFITPQDYDPKILLENLNLDSTIFRHSLRLAVVVVVGFSIGAYFSLDNAYWILLTIIVIMRPNYGLTKERSKQRIIGTLIGGAIAIGIVFFVKNQIVYAILGLLSLTLAFSLVQRNYKTAAVFITLSIVFIYSLLQPDVYNVIQYRIIDTLVGAGLAALGNLVLWPAWEVKGIKNVMLKSIEANKIYLEEIARFYKVKGDLPVSYKLARKNAFLETGNLNIAFQRMTQEPRSKQKEISGVYEIIGINQTFLAALASLGTYIRNHKTTSASVHFDILVQHTLQNLRNTKNVLSEQEIKRLPDQENTLRAGKALNSNFENLLQRSEARIEDRNSQAGENLQEQLREAHLVINQLNWLLELSEKLQKNITKTRLY